MRRLLMAGAAAASLWSPAAPAMAAVSGCPAAVVSPRAAAPGSTITVTGRTCSGDERVNVSFYQGGRRARRLVVTRSGPDSSFAVRTQVPVNAARGTALVAVQLSERTVPLPFRVTGAGSLARSGADVAPQLLVGSVATVIGVVMLLWGYGDVPYRGRRRRCGPGRVGLRRNAYAATGAAPGVGPMARRGRHRRSRRR